MCEKNFNDKVNPKLLMTNFRLSFLSVFTMEDQLNMSQFWVLNFCIVEFSFFTFHVYMVFRNWTLKGEEPQNQAHICFQFNVLKTSKYNEHVETCVHVFIITRACTEQLKFNRKQSLDALLFALYNEGFVLTEFTLSGFTVFYHHLCGDQ